jgi:translation elongation factor EF-4
MDYEFKEYRAVRRGEGRHPAQRRPVDALSIIVHRSQSQYRGRAVVAKMREIISRQMFDVAIQAAIGANIIARETSRPCARTCWQNATAATSRRKRKLLEKQKAGKKRMKQIGRSRCRRRPSWPSCRWKTDEPHEWLRCYRPALAALYLGGWYLGLLDRATSRCCCSC